MNSNELEDIEMAARLHDVGKIGVAESILTNSGFLSDVEWEVVREHPLITARILEPVAFSINVINFVLYHHERPDGLGYPVGLAGDDIPLGASIIKVADAYDAMTSDRTYRKPLSDEEAKMELIKNSGSQFRPAVVGAFLSAEIN